MSYEDLRKAFGLKKICEVCGVSRASESQWHSGRVLIPIKHLYALKVRWPRLDLNASVLSMCEQYNRYWVSRGRPGLLD